MARIGRPRKIDATTAVEAVRRLGSRSAAAAELGVSPPTLATRIAEYLRDHPGETVPDARSAGRAASTGEIMAEVRRLGSQAAAARHLGVSRQYVNACLKRASDE